MKSALENFNVLWYLLAAGDWNPKFDCEGNPSFFLKLVGMHVISMVGGCQNVFDTTSFGTNPGASIGNLDFWPTLEKSNFEGVNFYCPGFGS